MWYTGDLLFKAVHMNHPGREAVWEERIVLLEAEDESRAMLAAERLGKEGEHEYYVSKAENDLLRWTFARVQKIHPVEDATLHSGTELFSRFLRESEVQSLSAPFGDE
jgi:hypothetical protein